MADHDYESYPWLIEFDKKTDKQKMDTVINQLKYLENLVGTVSIILLFSICVFIALMSMSIIGGNINISSLISLIK
jgi:hypothetical protein